MLKKYIPFFILFASLCCYGQFVTTITKLNSEVTDNRNIRVYVPISVDVVRSNGIIVEISMYITNVVQTATEIDLNVYDLFYTTNLVEIIKNYEVGRPSTTQN